MTPHFLLLLVLSLGACAHSAQTLHLDNGKLSGDYASRIANDTEWRALATAPTRAATAHSDETKVIIDLQDHGRLYFLDSRKWEIHFYFIIQFMGGYARGDEERFAEREYGAGPERRFILGSVVHYRDSGVWAFELDFPDHLGLTRTVEAYRQVKAAMWNGADLRYHPVPAAHVAATDELARTIPIATTDEIFGKTRYQALNPGVAYGRVRIFTGPVRSSEIGPHDIPVLAELPLDLPVCAGVISGQLQTPLSHIAVLSVNRGTPNMSLRDATRDATLLALDGKVVRLHVSPSDYEIALAPVDEAQRAWALDEPRVAELQRDLRDAGLPRLVDLRGKDGNLVGAKAAGLAELGSFLPASVARAFAIPFHDYARHLEQSGLTARIAAMLSDKTFLADARVREQRLAELRASIEAAPVDAGLLARLHARIAGELGAGVRVRFRSSTNAEDLPGFNGAGLYDSTVAPAAADERQIADALRKVWSSVWSFPGFEERTHYGIAHEQVAMGVLVQESIDHPDAIGVAITANPYAQGLPGRLINVQIGEGSVTSPGPGEIPEQILLHTYPGYSIERLSSSSLTKRRILSDEEVTELGHLLDKVHSHFCGDAPWQTSTAMDVEFLVARGSRRIVLLQARPYRLSWSEGRGYAEPHAVDDPR